MSKKSANVSVRIEPEIKAQAEEILTKKGMTPTILINLLCNQIICCKGIPFGMRLSQTKPMRGEKNRRVNPETRF